MIHRSIQKNPDLLVRLAVYEQTHYAVDLDGSATQVSIAQLATRIWQMCGSRIAILSPCSGSAIAAAVIKRR
jgi:hypothetical protein